MGKKRDKRSKKMHEWVEEQKAEEKKVTSEDIAKAMLNAKNKKPMIRSSHK
jgi:hypothetical protein